MQGHTDDVRSVAPSHNGARIISGSDDKTIRIWNAMSVALLVIFSSQHPDPRTPHAAAIRSLAIRSKPGGSVSPMQHACRGPVTPAKVNAPAGKGAPIFLTDPYSVTMAGRQQKTVPFSSGTLHRTVWAYSGPALAIIGAQPTQLNTQRFVHSLQWTL